jgi:hypothetical protein
MVRIAISVEAFEGKPVGVRQRQAVRLLTAALAGVPRLATEVIAEAAKAGIGERLPVTAHMVFRGIV